MQVTTPPDGAGITTPCVVRLRPEARQSGPDGRTVLYLLQIAEEGAADATLNLRSALLLPELARLGRGLRRLARAGEPCAGLTLGWSMTLSGAPAAAACALTFTHEERGTTVDYPVLCTAAAIESFVDALEAEVAALS